ncbi:MAG: T9SS type A sorting domain-containing protein [Bacteroidales bacterium]|nr:T9SS type A sorting domain-containing protein [Bacteroidales bacterium]
MLLTSAVAQQVVLTFKGQDYLTEKYIQLSRIEIENKTKEWNETLNYPDTTAILTISSGLEDVQGVYDFALQQNTPNPFEGMTHVTLQQPEAGTIVLDIFDLQGKKVTSFTGKLSAGAHQFSIILPSPQVYLLTARNDHQTSSIKMVNTAIGAGCQIQYEGSFSITQTLKKEILRALDAGDEMLYTGYAIIDGAEQKSAAITRTEHTSEELTFDFTQDGIPCPGLATVTDYDRNTYKTVQIGKQCWMAENMRATHFVDGTEIALNEGSSAAHRFIAGDRADMIQTCGYLYDWNAVKYGIVDNPENGRLQGVCPTGWHVPTQAEWIQLFGYVRNREEYICGGDDMNFAKALCANFGWSKPFQGMPCSVGTDLSTNNATGFTVVPAGITDGYRTREFAESARLWTATSGSTGSSHSITFKSGSTTIVLSSNYTDEGLSVRCVKD